MNYTYATKNSKKTFLSGYSLNDHMCFEEIKYIVTKTSHKKTSRQNDFLINTY